MPPLLPSGLPENNYFAEGHPKSKRVLKDELFWEPGDDLSPLGGGGESDTITEFWSWRRENPNDSVYDFFQKWLAKTKHNLNPEDFAYSPNGVVCCCHAK